MAISGIAAGIIGSFLLGLTTIFLLRVRGRLVLRLPVLVGGAAGVLLRSTAYDHSHWGWSCTLRFLPSGKALTRLASLPCCVGPIENSDLICAAIVVDDRKLPARD